MIMYLESKLSIAFRTRLVKYLYEMYMKDETVRQGGRHRRLRADCMPAHGRAYDSALKGGEIWLTCSSVSSLRAMHDRFSTTEWATSTRVCRIRIRSVPRASEASQARLCTGSYQPAVAVSAVHHGAVPSLLHIRVPLVVLIPPLCPVLPLCPFPRCSA